MFNLEQSIADWRQQMLVAGIKTPVPLEELEGHLREEIERQTKSGLSEAEAFAVGIREIGQGHVLHNEFNKVTTGQSIRRVVLLMIGWVAAGGLLLYGMLCLEINWNLFKFSPRWNSAVPEQIVSIFGAIVAMWFLAKATRDRTSRAMSLLGCLLLFGIAFFIFFHRDFFHDVDYAHGKGTLSPLWFRGGLTLLSCLPGAFWIWWRRRNPAQPPVGAK
jgi:hypothetical protein